MTVRTKITLLITGAGLFSSLIFSIIVFFELLEQPFDVLDSVLKEEAQSVCEIIDSKRVSSGEPINRSATHVGYGYWIEIHDSTSGELLFQSALAEQFSIAPVPLGSKVVESSNVSYYGGEFSKTPGSKTSFWVRRMHKRVNGNLYVVQIAKPINKLQSEIKELAFGVVSGFVISIFVLIVISRFLAGIMLKPLDEMNELAQKVCDNNLGVRIPVGESRDEFSEHARNINTMLDRINSSFVRQRNFLFDTSHELKTPLATLRLVVDEINQSEKDNIPPLLQSSLKRMNIQILRMERLVKDLLKLASLEIVSTEGFHSVDLGNLLKSLADDYQYMAEAHGIKINIDVVEEFNMKGDKKMLYRALSNIFDNAIKYNENGGSIMVSSMVEGKELLCSVGNSGPGVGAQEVHSVFDQFYRGEKSRSVKFGGSGLGLAIVKRIVDIHSGTVRFESRENEWTSITLSFPVT